MARLDAPVRSFLAADDLVAFPVWVWSDDNEHYQPLSEPEVSPAEYGTHFIKATFAIGGNDVPGYLVGTETFYAFVLFINGKTVGVNLNGPTMLKRGLGEIGDLMNIDPLNFFPLKYESMVVSKDGRRISGLLMYP